VVQLLSRAGSRRRRCQEPESPRKRAEAPVSDRAASVMLALAGMAERSNWRTPWWTLKPPQKPTYMDGSPKWLRAEPSRVMTQPTLSQAGTRATVKVAAGVEVTVGVRLGVGVNVGVVVSVGVPVWVVVGVRVAVPVGGNVLVSVGDCVGVVVAVAVPVGV